MSANTASPDNIELTSLLASLRQRLPKIMLASAGMAALVFAVSSGIAPRYLAEAQLQVVAKGGSNPFADGKPDGGVDNVTVRMDKEAVNTHVRALMAPELVADIARQLHLEQKVEFNSALGNPDVVTGMLRLVGLAGPRAGESEQDRVLGTFSRQLEVYAAKDSRSIGIRATSIDPELAADIANELAETYRKRLASQRGEESNEVQKALEPRIAQLAADVVAADAEVEKFRGDANIFRGAQNTGLNEQQLGELTAELSRAKAARGEAEAKSRSARDLMKSGNAEVLPDVQKQPMMQSILQQRVRLERQISELSATLLPDHPRMRQLNADLAGLKKQIGAEVGRMVEGFEKEAKVAAAREAAVQKSIDEIKSRVVSSSTDEVKLRQLEGAAKAKRTELERLQAQLEASRMQPHNTAAGVEAQIVSKARASSVPVFPKKSNYAALAFVATFLLGLALTLVRSAMAAARPAAQRAPAARAPSAGAAAPAVARAAPAPAPAAAPERAAPHRAVAAAPAASQPAPVAVAQLDDGDDVGPLSLAQIASTIAVLPQQPTGFRTLVVGETNDVEAGVEAIEIGCELADKGMATVVVEWSPEGFSMARELERNPSPGMNELVTGAATFEQVVTSVPGSDLHFIAAGAPIARPGDVVDPDLVNLLLDALDEAYEHIIVVGRYDAAHALFESILGRFDAGVLVSDGSSAPSRHAAHGMFLGFEVTDIAVMRHERLPEAGYGMPEPQQRGARVQVAPVYAQGAVASADVAKGKTKAAPAGGQAAPAAKKSGFSIPGLSILGQKKPAAAEKPAAKTKRGKGKGKDVEEAPAYPPVPQEQLVARALRRGPGSPAGRSASA